MTEKEIKKMVNEKFDNEFFEAIVREMSYVMIRYACDSCDLCDGDTYNIVSVVKKIINEDDYDEDTYSEICYYVWEKIISGVCIDWNKECAETAFE